MHTNLQKSKGKKVEVPPWEAALVSSATSKTQQRKLDAARRQAEVEEAKKARISVQQHVKKTSFFSMPPRVLLFLLYFSGSLS